jgi:hypothetical protein
LARLDALAAERGTTRARLVRGVLESEIAGRRSAVAPDAPGRDELLELLAEKARQGTPHAIRALLVREEEQEDPRTRALRALEGLVRERQQ